MKLIKPEESADFDAWVKRDIRLAKITALVIGGLLLALLIYITF